MKLKFLATAAALMLAGNAQAAIVTFSTPISVPATFDGIYINLANGATGLDTAGSPIPAGWDINPYLINGVFTFFWNNSAPSVSGGVATGTVYTDLAPGSVVSSASAFTAASGGGGAGSTIAFQSTGTHTLGFRFFNEGTSAINYGYMRIQNTGSTGFPATILGWSFQNDGSSITVPTPGGSAVPEPASWAMMIGGFGLVGGALRRRATTARFARA